MRRTTICRPFGRRGGRSRVTARRVRDARVACSRADNRQAHTVVEVLCVMLLLSVLMNATLLFVFDGRRRCRDTMARIEMSQSSILLRKPWRDFIAALPPPVEIGDDGVLRADGYYAARRDDKLVLAGVDGVREYVLPAGGGLRFEIEACVDEASCIVLVIETNARDWQRRIVAVPRVSGSDAGVALTGMEANR